MENFFESSLQRQIGRRGRTHPRPIAYFIIRFKPLPAAQWLASLGIYRIPTARRDGGQKRLQFGAIISRWIPRPRLGIGNVLGNVPLARQ